MSNGFTVTCWLSCAVVPRKDTGKAIGGFLHASLLAMVWVSQISEAGANTSVGASPETFLIQVPGLACTCTSLASSLPMTSVQA
jgi:hypothetical protein